MKNKTLKKTLSVLLVVIMVLSPAPLNGFVGLKFPEINLLKLFDFSFKAEALTEGIYTYEVENGEVTITDCDNSASGDIIIPSTIDGYPVTSIGSSSFRCDALEKIEIPNSVEIIGDYAFYNLCSLTDVIIGSGVKTIGKCAFSACLQNIKFTVSDDNLFFSSDSDGWLYNKDKTKLIQASTGDSESETGVPSSVKIIGEYAFHGSSWWDIYLHEGILSIEDYAFADSSIPNWFTIPDSVTMIGNYAFENCYHLNRIRISDGIINLGDGAFANCYKIEEFTVDVNNKNYSSDENGVLYNKDKTELIQYPTASKRTTFNIPNSVTRIDDSAFYRCNSLEDIYYNGAEEDWKKIDIAQGNEVLTKVTIYFNDKPHEHSYSCETTKVATCTENGIKTYTCTCGSIYTETIVAMGHIPGEWEVVVEPTIQNEGRRIRYCMECWYEVESEVVPKLKIPEKVNSVSVEDVEILYKHSVTLYPVIDATEGADYTVSYSSSDDNIAKLDGEGNVSGVKRGEARITCTVTDSYGNTVTDTCKVEVKYAWWQWIIKIVLFGWIWY